MQPYVPPKLIPWITFGNDTVHLKPGAPDEVKPAFDKLKQDMEKAHDAQFPADQLFPKL